MGLCPAPRFNIRPPVANARNAKPRLERLRVRAPLGLVSFCSSADPVLAKNVAGKSEPPFSIQSKMTFSDPDGATISEEAFLTHGGDLSFLHQRLTHLATTL